ncbi:MAG: DUF4395 domain-containing protein [Thiolinea sp.]
MSALIAGKTTTGQRLFGQLWFQDPQANPVYINDTAVRIRAGLLLCIPLYMALTLYDALFTSNWLATGEVITDTYETDWDGNIIYSIEAIRKTYDYTVQTWVLLYGLFEMLAGLFVITSRLSPTILLSSWLARHQTAVWKPLAPKRFAWGLGAFFIATCLVFFNPDTVAGWLNTLAGQELLPETTNYMPAFIPLVLVWVCLGFMWLETVLGFCVGCQIHALLVRLHLLSEPCAACNQIDWDALAKRKAQGSATLPETRS